MVRKRPNIPVAIDNVDGTSRIVGSAELMRKPVEPRGFEAIIAKRKRGEKLTSLEVGQSLAVVKRAHEDAAGDVTIPFAALDVIGEVVLGRTNWQRGQAGGQKGKARNAAVHALWNSAAAGYFRKDPNASKSAVAKWVARDMERLYRDKIASGEDHEDANKVRGHPNTIRRVIKKPRKLSSAVR
jgi:hypothetical protein